MIDNIKEWYISGYPEDMSGQKINKFASFKDMLCNIVNFKTYIGIDNYILRERIFMEFAVRSNLSYDCIYSIYHNEYLK